MRIAFFLFSLVVLGFASSHAAVQTDTHTYIVQTSFGSVISIDRKTGQENFIKVGDRPRCLFLHEDFGYVLHEDSRIVSVIDLKQQCVTKKITVGEDPRSMVIHEEFGYVVNTCSNNFSVIDLKTRTVTQTIAVGRYPLGMVIYGDFGYVVNLLSSCLSVLSLDTHEIIKTIHLPVHPLDILIRGGKGYVRSFEDTKMVVIDFDTQKVIQEIDVERRYSSMVIHRNFAYVVDRKGSLSVIDLKKWVVSKKITVGCSPRYIKIYQGVGYVINESSHTLSVIDLEDNLVTATILLERNPMHIVFKEGFAYVTHITSQCFFANGQLSVIDLEQHKIVGTLSNVYSHNIDFSDTHVYWDGIRCAPIY